MVVIKKVCGSLKFSVWQKDREQIERQWRESFVMLRKIRLGYVHSGGTVHGRQ